MFADSSHQATDVLDRKMLKRNIDPFVTVGTITVNRDPP
jgi:hypothetical protein